MVHNMNKKLIGLLISTYICIDYHGKSFDAAISAPITASMLIYCLASAVVYVMSQRCHNIIVVIHMYISYQEFFYSANAVLVHASINSN